MADRKAVIAERTMNGFADTYTIFRRSELFPNYQEKSNA